MDKHKFRVKESFFFFILIGTILLFNLKYLNDFPSYTHAWTQSDRYALSLGFVNNGLNLLKPETYSLLKNHPDREKWKFPAEQSITAVDFPIHDYIPAVFMKLTGTRAPWVFRTYILIYSIVGLFFLYKLAFLWTKDILKSSFIAFFAATSPVFVFYQAGFLPTIPSLANVMIGIFFYSKCLLEKKQKHFWLAISFLTLAALSRTTFLIPLLAIFSTELIRVLRKKVRFSSRIVPVSVSIAVFAGYFLYNHYLREKYGAIFLNYFLPPSSFEEVIEIFKTVKEKWATQYFSKIHYLFYFILFLGGIYYYLKKGLHAIHNEILTILLFITITFMGCIAFSGLMLKQFPAHDYYFLDTFYFPVVMLLLVILAILPKIGNKKVSIISSLALMVFCAFAISSGLKSQEQRRVTGHWARAYQTIKNFQDADQFLDSIGVPKDSKILVLDAYTTNIPFILMDRKGYPVIYTKPEYVEQSLDWDYDYMVFQNEFFLSGIYKDYPAVIQKTKKIATNQKISVCLKGDRKEKINLHEYLGLVEENIVFQSIVDFETDTNQKWKNIFPDSTQAFEGQFSCLVPDSLEFGITYKTRNFPTIMNNNRMVLFSSQVKLESKNSGCELVLTINTNGKSKYYQSYSIDKSISNVNEWHRVHYLFQLPAISEEDHEFAIYIWNKDKGKLHVDNFGFRIY